MRMKGLRCRRDGEKDGGYPGEKIGGDVPAGVYFLMAKGKEREPIRIVKIK